jgi:hypothetical protein
MWRILNVGSVVVVLLALGLVLWALRQFVGGDLAALTGALLLWLAALLGISGYVIFVLKAPDNVQEARELIQSRLGEWYWPWLIAPGLWIGFVAQHPILLTASCLVIWEILVWLISVLPPRLPGEEATPALRLRRFARRAVILLGGTLVGSGMRVLLSI